MLLVGWALLLLDVVLAAVKNLLQLISEGATIEMLF